jgi:hypothetical protein
VVGQLSIGLAGDEDPAGRAVAAALRAGGHDVGPPAPDRAVLIDAASAPATPADPVREDVLPGLLELAERSGARVVLLSSVLVYAGAGEDWIEAAEPVIDPAPAHAALPGLELAVFASGARFLVLRMGILDTGAPGTGAAWIPLLRPADLGAWVAVAVACDLNGVYDAVSLCVRGAGNVSRRVSGEALAAVSGYEASAS